VYLTAIIKLILTKLISNTITNDSVSDHNAHSNIQNCSFTTDFKYSVATLWPTLDMHLHMTDNYITQDDPHTGD